MSKVFCFGVLLAGLGLCIGCGEPLATPPGDVGVDSPAYEQEMTEGTEAPTDAVDGIEFAPAETAPTEAAPEAPAPEAPAPEAPAVEEAAPAATDAP